MQIGSVVRQEYRFLRSRTYGGGNLLPKIRS
jgi:hypothetical protein